MQPQKVVLLVWDIMGQPSFREVLREAYFYGAEGALAVCDVTSKESLGELRYWVKAMTATTGKIPIVFLGNKCDLREETRMQYPGPRSLREEARFARRSSHPPRRDTMSSRRSARSSRSSWRTGSRTGGGLSILPRPAHALAMARTMVARCADAVFYNGRIYTLDPSVPTARAVAVMGGRIVAVGDDATVRGSDPQGGAKYDLGGKAVVPGFIDAHTHFIQMGVDCLSVDLRSTRTR